MRLLSQMAVLTACVLGTGRADALCLGSPEPTVRRLEALAASDASKAVKQARAAIATLERASTDAASLAPLYAVLAESYAMLELDADARVAASKGLRLAPDPHDPLHLQLLLTRAENIYDQAGIDRAAEEIADARATQSPGSLADTCLLITLGRLQFRQDLAGQAVLSLTQAYRASMEPSRKKQRVLAAGALSPAMRAMGDFAQALALNQEVIDWDRANGATLSLSVSLFLRGSTYMAMGEYRRAIEAYAQARNLSVQLADSQGVAFADVNTCESQIKLGQIDAAEPHCANALSVFTATQSVDMVKQTRALMAHIYLSRGEAQRAWATLDEVLEHGGAEMSARHLASIHELRARANAELGNFRAAYADLDEYARRYVASNNADRERQTAALRARFDTDRQIEQNARLQGELILARERAERQNQQLRWTVVATSAGAIVIALLTYILMANLRHRRDLMRLASLDGLTGLPNRRRTSELAAAALEGANTSRRALTVAVIDLDHFKLINDRCGHAAGDQVLMQFASIGRECVRTSDIFGRWGGEEFLLVMPDTKIDLALTVLERLRSRALEVALPSSSAGLRVTLSAGLATNTEDCPSLDDIIARSDSALYEAKNGGRDLVRVARDGFRTATTGVHRALGR
jgi:diguanylate cyclase (GGDEF)-like protein